MYKFVENNQLIEQFYFMISLFKYYNIKKTKRSIFNPLRWIWGMKYRYNRQSNLCVIDGTNCEELIKYDNLYAKITDEETGQSLWDLYWRNPVTQTQEQFVARENVTDGRKMKGTY